MSEQVETNPAFWLATSERRAKWTHHFPPFFREKKFSLFVSLTKQAWLITQNVNLSSIWYTCSLHLSSPSFRPQEWNNVWSFCFWRVVTFGVSLDFVSGSLFSLSIAPRPKEPNWVSLLSGRGYDLGNKKLNSPFLGKLFSIMGLEGRKCTRVLGEDFHRNFWVNPSWSLMLYFVLLDWIVLILVWFERSLHLAQVRWQSCPWPLKLTMSQGAQRTWIYIGRYRWFSSCKWVNKSLSSALISMYSFLRLHLVPLSS